MDRGFETLRNEIGSVNTTLTGKIDAQSGKLEKMAEILADLRSGQKVMFRIFGVVGSVIAVAGTLVGIGKALDWF
jgi:hypothetical protein